MNSCWLSHAARGAAVTGVVCRVTYYAVPSPRSSVIRAGISHARPEIIPVPDFNSGQPTPLRGPACALRQRGGVNGFGERAANVGKLAVFQEKVGGTGSHLSRQPSHDDLHPVANTMSAIFLACREGQAPAGRRRDRFITNRPAISFHSFHEA